MNLRRCAATLVALVSTAGPSLGQQYPAWDSRSPQYQQQQQQQRQQQEDRARADEKKKQEDDESSKRHSESMSEFMENQRKLQAKISGDVERDRAMFLKMPAVPAARNALLGKWRLARTKQRPANALAELNAMISGPACVGVFGDGIWDFRPQALYGNDAGIGEAKMTDVEYRGNAGIIGVVPKTFMRLLIFEVKGPDRVQELTSTRIGADPCVFVRVGATANAVTPTASTGARAGAAASPPQVASAAPAVAAAPTSSRPVPEICRQTFLDKLGAVGVNQVRQLADLRFKETLEGKVPNTQNLRIDLRGSACDDPRLNATLYDFDANGMLQSITYVWARPPGPTPAPIFSERVTQLSRFHSLPPQQSPSRLQADTSMGRLILEDLPERNLLLEAYKAPR